MICQFLNCILPTEYFHSYFHVLLDHVMCHFHTVGKRRIYSAQKRLQTTPEKTKHTHHLVCSHHDHSHSTNIASISRQSSEKHSLDCIIDSELYEICFCISYGNAKTVTNISDIWCPSSWAILRLSTVTTLEFGKKAIVAGLSSSLGLKAESQANTMKRYADTWSGHLRK